jgi:hypothetical protein
MNGLAIPRTGIPSGAVMMQRDPQAFQDLRFQAAKPLSLEEHPVNLLMLIEGISGYSSRNRAGCLESDNARSFDHVA